MTGCRVAELVVPAAHAGALCCRCARDAGGLVPAQALPRGLLHSPRGRAGAAVPLNLVKGAKTDGRAADCNCSTITGKQSWCWCIAGCGSLLELWEETQTLPASALQGVTQAMMSRQCWLSSTSLCGTNDHHCFSCSLNTSWTACTCFQW